MDHCPPFLPPDLPLHQSALLQIRPTSELQFRVLEILSELAGKIKSFN